MKKYINISSFGLSYSLKDSTVPEEADIIISDNENDIRYALNHDKAHIFISRTPDFGSPAKNIYIPDHPSLPVPDNDYIETVYLRHNRLTKTIAETERIIIKELCINDMEKLYHTPFGFKESMSEDEKKNYYNSYYTSMYDFSGFGYYGFFNKENKELLGYGGLSLEEGSEVPNAGYFIFDEFRQKGYASEGMDAVLSYAERVLFAEEIIFKICSSNTASLRTARKLSERHKSVHLVID